MLTLFAGLCRSRAARPLLWWVLALLLYALLPVPQQWVLFLIIGLGVALTVTVRRLREGGRDRVERAWDIAERLSYAVEDRIRYATPPPPQVQALYGPVYAEPVRPQIAPIPSVYDPGALLSAVAAVLAAEGLAVDAAPALAACADLLSWQGIAVVPAAPAPTAWALATGLAPGAARRYRAVPPGIFATCITAVLIADGAMPLQLSTRQAEDLIEAAARILEALGIALDPRAGDAGAWPVMTEIINAVPQGHQYGGR
jgi:hypothetical protein